MKYTTLIIIILAYITPSWGQGWDKCSRAQRKLVRAEKICPSVFNGMRDTIREIRMYTVRDTVIFQKDSLIYTTTKGDTITVWAHDTLYTTRWMIKEVPSNDTTINVFLRSPADSITIKKLEQYNQKLQKKIESRGPRWVDMLMGGFFIAIFVAVIALIIKIK